MPASDEQKSPIQVIDRMMRLLEVLAQHPEPLGLKQIAQYTGLHPSTAHRILSSMSADRFGDRIQPLSYRLRTTLLERDLARVQRQGGATDKEQAEVGVRSAAPALRDDAGHLVAALSLST